MRWNARLFRFVPLCFVLLGIAPAAFAQNLFLDTNGNGVRDSGDMLQSTGSTTIDIWLETDRNRDGSPAICQSDPSGRGLTINSYTVAFDVLGGTVRWGPMHNRLVFTDRPICFATYADTTDATSYHNGWGWMDILPPGRYLIASMTVEVASGLPSIMVVPYRRLNPIDWTSFGTKCDGRDFDNTYKLGNDWTDAQGLGPPQANAGGTYLAKVGQLIHFNGSSSLDPAGVPLTFSWDFGDGSTASGPTPSYAYAGAGHYTVTLTVSNGTETSTALGLAIVTEPQQPIARAGGPYSGYAGESVRFSGATSYDPDGDAISFSWNFSDGGTATGDVVTHTFAAMGTYVARLTVNDGTFSDTDEAIASIQDARSMTPPAAQAGGPYASIVGRAIMFDGTRSSDADGDPLEFTWQFGDGPDSYGFGPVAGHAYTATGIYTVRLTVSDGTFRNSSLASATIRQGLQARAFGDSPVPSVRIGPSEPPLVLRIEPVGGSFRLSDADPWGISMRRTAAGVVSDIFVETAALTEGDSDGNGVAEFTATFTAENLARLFGDITHAVHETVTISGGLHAGGEFLATIALNVRPGAAQNQITVWPNPFNPQTLVTFNLSTAGAVSAHLFDVRGRMVRTVYRDQPLDAGTHEMTLDARSDQGSVLASGIYFLRLLGPDGPVTKRVIVSK